MQLLIIKLITVPQKHLSVHIHTFTAFLHFNYYCCDCGMYSFLSVRQRGRGQQMAALFLPFEHFICGWDITGEQIYSVKWLILRNMDTQSRSTSGAHKQLNPDKSLTAAVPIAASLLACQCSHCGARTCTRNLPSPLFIHRKIVSFVQITCRGGSF